MKKLMNTKDGKFLLGVAAITIVMLIGCLGPFSIYTKHILLQTVFYAYMATVWNLMCGYTGRMSLGHSAYIAVGAYTSLILFRNYGLTPWVGMILGGILAMGLMFLIVILLLQWAAKVLERRLKYGA